MKTLRRYKDGGRPQGEPVQDYLDRVDPNRLGMSVQNTFGPEDYIMGAFPFARALSPAAKALGKYFGLGAKNVAAEMRAAGASTGFTPLQSQMNRQGQVFNEFLEQTGSPEIAADLTRRAFGEAPALRIGNDVTMIRQTPK